MLLYCGFVRIITLSCLNWYDCLFLGVFELGWVCFLYDLVGLMCLLGLVLLSVSFIDSRFLCWFLWVIWVCMFIVFCVFVSGTSMVLLLCVLRYSICYYTIFKLLLLCFLIGDFVVLGCFLGFGVWFCDFLLFVYFVDG